MASLFVELSLGRWFYKHKVGKLYSMSEVPSAAVLDMCSAVRGRANTCKLRPVASKASDPGHGLM